MTIDAGRCPTGRAATPSGAQPPTASSCQHGIPNALEGAARGIAANKRGVFDDHPSVDRCWHSYVGQARAALSGSGLLQMALPYIDSLAAAESSMDGFGEIRARQADVDAREIRIALGFNLPPINVGDVLRPALTDADFEQMLSERTGA